VLRLHIYAGRGDQLAGPLWPGSSGAATFLMVVAAWREHDRVGVVVRRDARGAHPLVQVKAGSTGHTPFDVL
jgi:hypothetical protein